MTPPEFEPEPSTPSNKDIPRSRETINLPGGIRVTTLIEVKQWPNDPEGSHCQDWAATNTHMIRIQQGEAEAGKVPANPCIAVADGLTLPKGPHNFSALVAQEAASIAVQEFTYRPLTPEDIRTLNNAVRQELASENWDQGEGSSTLVVAQLIPHPQNPELRIAGVGDSHLLVIAQDERGNWRLKKYTDILKQGQVGKSGGLTSVIGLEQNKLSPQVRTIPIPPGIKRMIVIAASDGLVALGMPEANLQQLIAREGINENGEFDPNLIANSLFDQSQAQWQFLNTRRSRQGKPPIGDDMAIAIMDIDFEAPHSDIPTDRTTPERPKYSTDEIVEKLGKASGHLTKFWEKRLNQETATPPTTGEIVQVLQAIAPLAGQEPPDQWAKQQARIFMNFWKQIVENEQQVDENQLTYITRQAGLREILRAANNVIQNERPGLFKSIRERIQKAFGVPRSSSNRIYNIFKEAQIQLATKQNQIRQELQRAKTLKQVAKILKDSPILISDTAWYPTAGYRLLLQQTINKGAVPRFPSITNTAGLRKTVRRIWQATEAG